MDGKIHSIETFGLVDGPGVRYVLFLQGCNMRCKYCHNPETWSFDDAKFTVSAKDAFSKAYKYKNYWRKNGKPNGGITVSGGEPLLQIDFVTEFFKLAKEKGVHTTLDSSGSAFTREEPFFSKFNELIKYTDLVMLDIKHIDREEHKKLTGHYNDNILAFAKFLSEHGVPIWIRHVVVPGITDKEEYLFRLGEFISQLKTLKALDVLPYHTMGKVKYEQLGIDYPLGDTPPLDKEDAVKARDVIMRGLKAALKKRK